MATEASLPNLLCKEDESSLSVPRDWEDGTLDFCSVSESDCEFIEMLFRRETSFRPDGDDNSDRSERSWLKRARLDAVRWILETRALFGYHYCTAYLSAIYFDRFLKRRTLTDGKPWLIPLLSIACLSLAAKMEEREVRALTEYHVDGYEFQGNAIQRMELMLLNDLEWKMSYMTPFTYLNYFAAKFCEESRHKELVIRASKFILAIMEEVNVAEHRPSIIAAAAVFASYDCQLTKTVLENKMEAVPSWGSLDKEQTFSCYSIFRETLLLKTPKSIVSTNLLSSDAIDDSTVTSRDGTKRRLAFDDEDDQQCPGKKISKS